MAYKSSGKAGKSASGASMSKYDVEVEARLQALEAEVAELKGHQHEASPATSSVTDSDLNAKLDSLIFALSHAQGVKQHIQHLHGDLQQY